MLNNIDAKSQNPDYFERRINNFFGKYSFVEKSKFAFTDNISVSASNIKKDALFRSFNPLTNTYLVSYPYSVEDLSYEEVDIEKVTKRRF